MKMKPTIPTPRHVTTRMAKFKDGEGLLKAEREKQLGPYKGALIKLCFSTKTLQARRIGMEYSK